MGGICGLMGNCLIQMNGAGVNTDGLTASSGDVIKGKTFIGNTGADQTGTMEERGSPQIILPVNGSHNFLAGHYSGGSVTQNIPTAYGQTIFPGNQQKVAEVNGKYMTGNIIVNGVDGLVPGNIKKGAVVGGVTGTYEGYENNDPNRPYYRGTFYEGQSMSKLKALNSGATSTGQVSFQRDMIVIYCEQTDKAPVCVLNGAIDFSKYKNLEVVATSGVSVGKVYFFQNLVYSFILYGGGNYNPELGDMYLASVSLSHDVSDPALYRMNDDFNISQTGYCYFNFNRIGESHVTVIRFIPK